MQANGISLTITWYCEFNLMYANYRWLLISNPICVQVCSGVYIQWPFAGLEMVFNELKHCNEHERNLVQCSRSDEAQKRSRKKPKPALNAQRHKTPCRAHRLNCSRSIDWNRSLIFICESIDNWCFDFTFKNSSEPMMRRSWTRDRSVRFQFER